MRSPVSAQAAGGAGSSGFSAGSGPRAAPRASREEEGGGGQSAFDVPAAWHVGGTQQTFTD